MFRLCAAGFALLLVLLVLFRWYWYVEVWLKHKHQYALQVQTINMGLDKVSMALLVKLFYRNNYNSAAAIRYYRLIKGIRRGLLSVPGLKNIIRKFKLTGDLGIAPGVIDVQLRQKLLKK